MATKWGFFKVLFYPLKIIPLIFKLKLRHTLVLIFLIVMLFSAVGEAWHEKNVGIFFLALGRVTIGADANISHTIENIATSEKITWANHSWLFFNMMGSMYLIGYIFYYFYRGCQAVIAPDTTVVGAFIAFFVLMYPLKMVFFIWDSAVTTNNFVLVDFFKDGSNWTKAIPFHFVIDFIKYFDAIYMRVEPITTNLKNLTQPFAGLGNGTA